MAREARRKIATAAGDIERSLSGAQIGQRQRKALPQPVCAGRHQIVHQIVMLGDRVEYAADAVRLLGRGHALEAEVRGGALLCHGHLSDAF